MTILVFTLPPECKQPLEQNLPMWNQRGTSSFLIQQHPKEQLNSPKTPQIKPFSLRL